MLPNIVTSAADEVVISGVFTSYWLPLYIHPI